MDGLEEVRTHTKVDELLQKLSKIVAQGWPHERSAVPEELRCNWNYRNEIVAQNGILFKGHKVPNQP